MKLSSMLECIQAILHEYGDIDISKIEDGLGNYIHITEYANIAKLPKTWFGENVLSVDRIKMEK